MTQHFDVVVLGAGPGGYVAAIRAAQLGKSVAVIEKQWWGGVCLNVGCIPTKALLRNAELAHIFTREADTFGIEGEVTFNYKSAFDRSRSVSDRMVKGVHFLMRKNKITELNGWGTFVDAKTIRLETDNGTDDITFESCIIAVGATTKMLPGTQRSARVFTYEEQILSDQLPSSIVICGAGAIGTEFAYVLANYGVRGHHGGVLRPHGAQRGSRGRRRAAEGVQEARREGAHQHQGGRHRGARRRRPGAVSALPVGERGRCSRPTASCSPSASSRAPPATAWRTPGSSSPTAARSPSTTSCTPTFPASTPSATSPAS